MNALAKLDFETKKFERQAIPDISEEWTLAIASGASVGGARRKTLVSGSDDGYLVKFQQKNDTINMPRVEHATMRLAACAGLTVATTRVEVINGKDALFVTRFDIVKGVPCRQLLSFDTLLKGQANEYGDLANVLIKQVSTSRLAYCLEQLFRQMCINICINNTDDHLKTFLS